MILTRKNYSFLFLFSIIIQLLLSSSLFKVSPNIDIMKSPQNYNKTMIEFISDKELAFRVMALDLQIMGDSFGRSTPLSKYDYDILYKWFKYLDEFNNTSDFTPAIATYYYGSINDNYKKSKVVKYLVEHSDKRMKTKWWWMYQASFMSYYYIKDINRALEIAYVIHNTKEDIPIWTRQLAAFYHESRGEKEHAMKIITNIVNNYKDISEHEMNFMHYFIKKRISNNP